MNEVGMIVEFNGKKNVVLYNNSYKEYGIGEMLCELSNLSPIEIRDIIYEAPYFSESFNENQVLEEIDWLNSMFSEKYGYVTAAMLAVEFSNRALEFISIDNIAGKTAWMNIITSQEDASNNKVMKYMLEKTGFTEMGYKTNGQFLLSVYYAVSLACCTFKSAVIKFENCNEEDKTADELISLFSVDYKDIQHIEYCIMVYNSRLNSVYTIKSIFSLLFFEFAHLIEAGITYKKCENCGRYFVPQNRSDTKYCNYPSPTSPDRTCKEVGAQLLWRKKETSDSVTKLYRQVYMRRRMQVSRHPESKELRKRFYEFIDEAKEKRISVEKGKLSEIDFINWIDKQ